LAEGYRFLSQTCRVYFPAIIALNDYGFRSSSGSFARFADPPRCMLGEQLGSKL